MRKVLAHRRSKAPLGFPFFPISFIFFAAFFSTFVTRPASAQILSNGQLFTNALSIVDSPAPQRSVTTAVCSNCAFINFATDHSELHAGSDINIAIEVSTPGLIHSNPFIFEGQVTGDGKIPLAAAVPGSGAQSGYNGLEIYLVSDAMNMTVTSNGSILTQEPGSTVKHLNWPIPSCVPAGPYNVSPMSGFTSSSDRLSSWRS